MSSNITHVVVLGATGQTGSVIVNALLDSKSPEFKVTSLTRPSSLQKPAVIELANRGVEIVAADLNGPAEELEKALGGVDVVISTIYGGSLMDEIPLIDASKSVGVKRYLPCFFATVAPPKGGGGGVAIERYEEVLNYAKKLNLPYTVIDVGWWYQVTLPRLPSGRIDYAVMETMDGIAGDGNIPFAITDVRDVGKYVARIIVDPRTLNRMVLAYNEVKTHNQLYDLLEGLSGEKMERKFVPIEAIRSSISEIEATKPSADSAEFVTLCQYQYWWYSCCVRGDNTPTYAKYLGYLTTKELYPDAEWISLESYAQEVLDGKAKRVYEHLEHLTPARADTK